jgi:hypothetical protein
MGKVKFVDTSLNKSIAELLSKQDHRTLVLWATNCAEHVLPYFEEKYPKDNRPRKAIEAGRAWVRGEIVMSEARTAAFATHAAARDTNQDGACAAARARRSCRSNRPCGWSCCSRRHLRCQSCHLCRRPQ